MTDAIYLELLLTVLIVSLPIHLVLVKTFLRPPAEAPPDWGQLQLDGPARHRVDCCATHRQMADQANASLEAKLTALGIDLDRDRERFAVVVGMVFAGDWQTLYGPFGRMVLATSVDALAHRTTVEDLP